MRITLNYNAINWSSIVEYDESSSTFLRWKVTRVGNGNATTKFPKDEAGTIIRKGRSSKYVSCKVAYNGDHYTASRIIYILFYGSIPNDKVIDHIDRNSLNNNISNLRLVDEKLNCRNLSKKSNNSSGVTGVSYRITNGHGYWCAEWTYTDNGVRYRGRKQFSSSKLGHDVAFQMACTWRENEICKLIADGVGFTSWHGT